MPRGTHFLRGGAFKPQHIVANVILKPGEGVEWMVEAKRKSGIPIITEVMEEKYIPLIAEAADMANRL